MSPVSNKRKAQVFFLMKNDRWHYTRAGEQETRNADILARTLDIMDKHLDIIPASCP